MGLNASVKKSIDEPYRALISLSNRNVAPHVKPHRFTDFLFLLTNNMAFLLYGFLLIAEDWNLKFKTDASSYSGHLERCLFTKYK